MEVPGSSGSGLRVFEGVGGRGWVFYVSKNMFLLKTGASRWELQVAVSVWLFHACRFRRRCTGVDFGSAFRVHFWVRFFAACSDHVKAAEGSSGSKNGSAQRAHFRAFRAA